MCKCVTNTLSEYSFTASEKEKIQLPKKQRPKGFFTLQPCTPRSLQWEGTKIGAEWVNIPFLKSIVSESGSELESVDVKPLIEGVNGPVVLHRSIIISLQVNFGWFHSLVLIH